MALEEVAKDETKWEALRREDEDSRAGWGRSNRSLASVSSFCGDWRR